MPNQQPVPTLENHFVAGLKTEFTGLNFPDNAATDTQNFVFQYTGDVSRRGGINFEANSLGNPINVLNIARSSFRWLNAGGDGETQVLVEQIGTTLYFWLSSNATIASPLSTTLIGSTVSLLDFQSAGNVADPSISECQYTIGNGYLFVFHPNCDPFYCIYSAGTVTASLIKMQIRDFIGIPEPNVPDNLRPNSLTSEHTYNLINQGWSQGSGWSATSSYSGEIPLSVLDSVTTSGVGFTLGITTQTNTTSITNGSNIQLILPVCAGTGSNPHVNGSVTLVGIVTSYVAPFNTITMNIISNSNTALNFTGRWAGGNFIASATPVSMNLINVGFINAWFSALGNYPSNADIWWLYKDNTNKFSPGTTFTSVQTPVTPAPKGSFVLNPFIQDRATVSGIGGLTAISTTLRPSTGAFYASRVFYAGVNASQQATGDAPYTTWTENIYFSQIIESPLNFGRCYQTNDPTDQNLFEILPSDGGVITIPGCGAVYKLFALRFGLLVFAANGIWFISGSSGIGFTANDYAITKISNIQAVSGTSFIDVQGYPFFWNQEGIYQVTPSSQAGSAHSPDIQLDVRNLCLGTILSYYDSIPLISKSYARGDYNMLDYIVQWCFRSTNESGISNRYTYDTILNYNVITQAFYPYTLSDSFSYVTDVKYIQNPGGSGNPSPIFKYITVTGNKSVDITFSEENDFTNYVDFISENNVGYNYTSYFVAGYKLPGQGLRKMQVPYVYMFSRNPGINAYGIRAIWDYAGSPVLGQIDALSGKWSTRQVVTNNSTDFTMIYRKIRLRGRGLAVQIRIDSQPGQPCDLMGWSVWNEVNPGI